MNKPIADVEKREQATGSGWSWSLGGSIVASLCCAGPAVAVLLGLGGASFLLGLSRFRIPLLLLGLGFAALGVVKALRQSRQSCSPDQHRRNQWLIPSMTLATFAVTYGLLTFAFPTAVYNSLSPNVGQKTNRLGQPNELSSPPNLALPSSEEAAPEAGPREKLGTEADLQPAETPGQANSPSAATATQSLAYPQLPAAEASSPANPEVTASMRRVTLAISGMT